MKLKLLLPLLTVAAFTQPALFAETGDDNPTGVAGTYNGEVTTGCAYDSYTANAKRVVEDIVVPGSVGAYPLKWTRYFNSHLTYADNTIGGAWRSSYRDYMHFGSVDPCTPDGRRIPKPRLESYGVEDYVETVTDPQTFLVTGEILHMADGGKIISNQASYSGTAKGYFYPVQIIDPYGQITTLSWTLLSSGLRRLDKVTEPGGRYLQINWDTTNSYITSVQAFDGIAGHTTPMQSVTYMWTTQTLSLPDGSHPNPYNVLTRADYSDGTSATYTYIEGNYPVPCSTPQSWLYSALLKTADDTHYAGPMKQIAYKYAATANKTRISSENHLVNGTASEAVSTLTGVASTSSTQLTTETRGDGPQRNFNYYKVPGSGNCAGQTPPDPTPTDGKLYSYTDFQGHTTTLTYETDDTKPSAGFITAVMDANNHTTTYTRQTGSWGVTTITHPDNTTITQKYWPNDSQTQPYYLWKRTDERGNTTTYNRDANNRIIEKDYPSDSNGVYEYETFTYNSLDEVLTHRMKNGAYEHFNYDSRGLLLAKTNPTWNSDWTNSLASDPQTTFTYYTSADYNGVWTDRVKTETDPRGLMTQFDYDRTLDANGQNSGFSTSQTPVGGRGLVTRITHLSDSSNYQSFGFDKYANKLWQEDELRERVTYIYDDYRRVLTITNPLNQTVVNTYTPTNGTNTSSYVHTTSSIYTTTTPTGIVTKNIYDANFRKTSTTQAYGTSLAATTTFAFDPVGNPTGVTDPLNHTTTTAYDTRNRKITVTNALNQSTQWFYDFASNVTSIQRADGTTETKHYDQMNRAIDDTVPQTNTINVTTTFTYYPGNVQYGGLPQQVIDADGHITTFTAYDPSGLKTTVTYPNGDTHGFVYDNDHNLVSRRTVNGTTQNFSYDNRNRKVTMFWTNPTNVANFTAEWALFGYDVASQLSSAENETSIVTRSYDNAGRLTLDRQKLQILPFTAVSRKVHGSAGIFDIALPLTGVAGIECRSGGVNNAHQLIVTFPRAITFANASVTTGTGTIASTSISPDNTQVTINLTGVTNAQTILVTLSSVSDGTTTNDVVIGMGVLLGDTTGDGLVNSSDTAQTQSQSGQPVTISNFPEDVNVSGTITSSDISLVQSQSGTGLPSSPPLTQPASSSPNIDVQYAYDNDGKDTRLYVTSAGYDYTFSYDAMGRFEKIYPTGSSVAFQYYYDAASNEVERYNSMNTVAQFYGRDALNRMSERDVKVGANMLSSEAYGYDTMSRMLSVAREDGKTDAFTYYLDGELWTAQYGASSRSVTYNIDQMGNRTSVVDTGVTTNYAQTAGGLNQYGQVGGEAVVNDNEHGMNSYQGTTYGYVNDERLSSVSSVNNNYQLAYDALGRCVKRTLNNVATYYVYDGEKPILEYNAANAVVGRNLYGKGIDEILMRIDPTLGTFFYQDDHEGSVTQLTSGAGAIIERYRYDVFGAPTIYNGGGTQISPSAFNNRFLFTGREYTSNFGIYEYRARAYHPGLGRFTGEDPKGFEAGDYNLFRYCHNDPEDATDPMGLEDILIGYYGFGGIKGSIGNAALRDYVNAHHGNLFNRTQIQNAVKYVLYREHSDPAPNLTLIGYSRGAGTANTTSEILGQHNVTVDHQITIDPAHWATSSGIGTPDHLTVPKNVRQADNYYQHNDHGLPEGGSLANPGPTRVDHDLSDTGVNHLTIVGRALSNRSSTRQVTTGMRTFGMIDRNGAAGGGTAWGQQANGKFVDSPGSGETLAGDIMGAQGGAIHPVPRWLY
jgi:RHS repeat-associated protein